MTESKDSKVCSLPHFAPVPTNSTASFVNDVVLCAVNEPFCVFAYLANLAVIIAVIKTLSLQRPCNILLCSLAITDCLTGLVNQPLFVTWCLIIQRIHKSCDHQKEVFNECMLCLPVIAGWSVANLSPMSFDRFFALSDPLMYRADVTKKGNEFIA